MAVSSVHDSMYNEIKELESKVMSLEDELEAAQSERDKAVESRDDFEYKLNDAIFDRNRYRSENDRLNNKCRDLELQLFEATKNNKW